MKRILSVQYCTRNEQGAEEIQIEYYNGFFRDLFKKPNIVETFVGSGTVWYNKKTFKRAGTSKEYELCSIAEAFKYQGRQINYL